MTKEDGMQSRIDDLTAERDKLVAENYYLAHDAQSDVLTAREQVAELRAALAPFAKIVSEDRLGDNVLVTARVLSSMVDPDDNPNERCFTVGDCRRAAALLAKAT